MRNQKNEQEFIERIDCNFRYRDQANSKALIDEATAISQECVFAVIHELVRLPKSEKANKTELKLLLNYINDSFDHPLKRTVFSIALAAIEGREIPSEEATAAIREIGTIKGCYSALNIVYFAAWSEEIEEHYNEIIQMG